MAGPLIATKFYVPTVRPGLVPRPRLRERLRLGADVKLTLIAAPAGFGKTTLLAEWLNEPHEDRSVAWLSLDAADHEPVSFWTYVMTALRTAVPGVGSNALELLAASQAPAEQFLTTVVNELASAPHSVWLVLDDYHLVDNSEVSGAMAVLLEQLPAQVHVVLSTRADPDLPLSRLRVRGELVEIRARDLRFTSDEATEYLNAVTGLQLPTADLAALTERTEGWIAALQLAALSLQGRDDVSGFIARFAGDDRYIVDYLVEEVLQHQPDVVRDFLLRTAVLDRLTGPLCDAVTGRNDGTRLLMTLERANLFLVPLDDQRQWYRYHHLFADVLRARLRAEQPDLVRQLHQRASRWYETHDAVEEAVRHALAARDYDHAADLMELAVPMIRRHRTEATLLGWLKELPDETVRHSPVLSVFYGYMLMVAGDPIAFETRLDDAERALAAVPDGSPSPWAQTDEFRILPATIAVYRASLAQARGDVSGMAAQARRALELAGPNDHLARGGAAGFLGFTTLVQGDVPGALDRFTQAVASLHAAGTLVDELSSTVMLADMWLAVGRPSEARRLYERAMLVAEANGEAVARGAADLHVGLSEMDRDAGDLGAAGRHLDAAAALMERLPMTESRYRRFVAMSRVAEAQGDRQEAINLLEQAERLYLPGFFPEVRPIAAMKARIWIANGHLSRAVAWARDRGVSPADDISYLNEFDHLTLVRLLIAQHRAHHETGRLDDALHLLAGRHAAAELSGRAGSFAEIRMLEALAHDALGDRPAAREALVKAWAEAPEPDTNIRLFLDEGAPMMDLLRDVEQHPVIGQLARAVLSVGAARRGESPESTSAERPPSLAEPLSPRELQVLRLLASELSGPQIARELFVSHNTLRTHTKHIFTKLDVTNRRAAVRRARELGVM